MSKWQKSGLDKSIFHRACVCFPVLEVQTSICTWLGRHGSSSLRHADSACGSQIDGAMTWLTEQLWCDIARSNATCTCELFSRSNRGPACLIVASDCVIGICGLNFPIAVLDPTIQAHLLEYCTEACAPLRYTILLLRVFAKPI